MEGNSVGRGFLLFTSFIGRSLLTKKPPLINSVLSTDYSPSNKENNKISSIILDCMRIFCIKWTKDVLAFQQTSLYSKYFMSKNTKVLLHLPRYVTSCSDVIRCHDVIPWRHVTSWHHTIGQDLIFVHSNQKILKMTFFWPCDLDLWPMTLTFELVREIIKVNPCVKFCDHTPNGSAVRALTDRHTDTHTHTDGSVFITSTADAGGNNERPLRL